MFNALNNPIYPELDGIAVFLLSLMIYNSVKLYKMNFRAPFTRLLIVAVVLCLADFLMNIVPVTSDPEVASFIAYGVFIIDSLLCGSFFCEFALDEFLHRPKRKWITVLAFYVPPILAVLLYATIPFYFSLHGGAYLYSKHFFIVYYSFHIIITYLVIAVLLAVVMFFVSRKKNPAIFRKCSDTMYFILLTAVLLLIQITVWDSADQCTCIVLALSLSYFTIRRNTGALVTRRAETAAAEADLNTAKKIQTGALPSVFPPFPQHPEVELYAEMHTSKEVGGDFFDCFELNDHQVCFLIADVSGKGVPAALFMMKAKTVISDFASIYSVTSDIFSHANNVLCENNEENMFATAWIGILDTDTGVLEYTNAGHNYPCLAHAGKEFEFIHRTHGVFLGGYEGIKYKKDTIQLEKGDTLFLYTDGFTEAHNFRDELFGDQRLLDFLNFAGSRNGRELLPQAVETVNAFAGDCPQFDDITLMCVRYQPD